MAEEQIALLDEISGSMRELINIWRKVLQDTETLVSGLIARLDQHQAGQGTGSQIRIEIREHNDTDTDPAVDTTVREESEDQTTGMTNANQTNVKRTRHGSAASASSANDSVSGVESLRHVLNETDSVGSRRSRTTGDPQLHPSPTRSPVRGGNSRRPNLPSPETSRTAGGRRRDVRTKACVKENICELNCYIKRLEKIRDRMCSELTCNSKGNASYDAAAVLIDETVKQLDRIDIPEV